MIAKYRSEQSLHGHRLDVLKSGLQKYIRRGNEQGALYCAGELDCFSDCGQEGKRIRTNLIHRLMIIFIEDMGLVEYALWPSVARLVSKWLSDRSDVLTLQRLVRLLCRCRKERSCSYARAYGRTDRTDQTDDPKWESIRWLVQTLDSDSTRETEKQVEQKLESMGIDLTLTRLWCKEIKTKERQYLFLLPLLHHLFPCKGTSSTTLLDDDTDDEWDPNWTKHRALPSMQFDDFVYDKHVKGGNAGNEFWVHVSSQVENRVRVVPELFECIYEHIYESTYESTEKKKVEKKVEKVQKITVPRLTPTSPIRKETDYELIVRCQLVCTRNKTDTMMVIHPDTKKMVFLKGPYASQLPIEEFIHLQELKKQTGMPFVKSRLVYIVPDRWDKTPIGIRNSLDLKQAHPYLECDALFDRSRIGVRVHSSTHWPNTEVMDMSHSVFDPFKLNEQQVREYAMAVQFRQKYNLCEPGVDRNYVLGDDGHVYSVDEEFVSTKMDFRKALKKRRYELVTRYVTLEE